MNTGFYDLINDHLDSRKSRVAYQYTYLYFRFLPITYKNFWFDSIYARYDESDDCYFMRMVCGNSMRKKWKIPPMRCSPYELVEFLRHVNLIKAAPRTQPEKVYQTVSFFLPDRWPKDCMGSKRSYALQRLSYLAQSLAEQGTTRFLCTLPEQDSPAASMYLILYFLKKKYPYLTVCPREGDVNRNRCKAKGMTDTGQKPFLSLLPAHKLAAEDRSVRTRKRAVEQADMIVLADDCPDVAYVTRAAEKYSKPLTLFSF